MVPKEKAERLLNSKVVIFGTGGVGGAVVHMLARTGISNLTIVDFDRIDQTNINRQLVAFHSNIGKFKVDELEKQIHDINPDCNVKTFKTKLSAETIEQFDLNDYDYIVDCIDDLPAKKVLIKYASTNKLNILCAMGAGNRYSEIPQFEISNITKTSYDPIAKILRKFCATERINKLNVCYTKQKAVKFDCKTVGSVIYYPINMASVMCAKIVNDLLAK